MKTIKYTARLPQIRVSPELKKLLENKADQEQVTLADIMREGLQSYVKTPPLVPIIGVLTGGPEDAEVWARVKARFQGAQ